MRHAPLHGLWTTPKSRVSKVIAAPYLSPYPLRRTRILTQTDCLTFSFLPEYRIEPMTRCARRRRHADSPILSLSRRVRESKGAARSAPKARAVMPRKPWSKSCMDPLRISESRMRGGSGVGGFISTRERDELDGSLPGPNTRLH